MDIEEFCDIISVFCLKTKTKTEFPFSEGVLAAVVEMAHSHILQAKCGKGV